MCTTFRAYCFLAVFFAFAFAGEPADFAAFAFFGDFFAAGEARSLALGFFIFGVLALEVSPIEVEA